MTLSFNSLDTVKLMGKPRTCFPEISSTEFHPWENNLMIVYKLRLIKYQFSNKACSACVIKRLLESNSSSSYCLVFIADSKCCSTRTDAKFHTQPLASTNIEFNKHYARKNITMIYFYEMR